MLVECQLLAASMMEMHADVYYYASEKILHQMVDILHREDQTWTARGVHFVDAEIVDLLLLSYLFAVMLEM